MNPTRLPAAGALVDEVAGPCRHDRHEPIPSPAYTARQLEVAAGMCHALSDPSRLRLLLWLTRGEMCVSELVELEQAKLGSISARLQTLQAPGRLEQSLSEHIAVFAALKARDCEGAEAAMRTHLHRQREALRVLATQERARLIG